MQICLLLDHYPEAVSSSSCAPSWSVKLQWREVMEGTVKEGFQTVKLSSSIHHLTFSWHSSEVGMVFLPHLLHKISGPSADTGGYVSWVCRERQVTPVSHVAEDLLPYFLLVEWGAREISLPDFRIWYFTSLTNRPPEWCLSAFWDNELCTLARGPTPSD